MLVFTQFEGLAPGEAFELVNDHDPLGLLQQFNALLPGQFTWDYRGRGPSEWRVVVGRTEDSPERPHEQGSGCCGGCG